MLALTKSHQARFITKHNACMFASLYCMAVGHISHESIPEIDLAIYVWYIHTLVELVPYPEQ